MKRPLRFLLVNLPWQRGGQWGVRAGSRWPHIRDEKDSGYVPYPFFLGYAASLLKQYKKDVFLIDAIAERMTQGPFIEKALSLGADFLVAETSVPSFDEDLALLEKIASFGIRVILCGPNAETYQPRFLEENPFVSFVLFGEYEWTLLELTGFLEGAGGLNSVKGLIYRQDGRVIKNAKRESLDIDLLPWPDRDSLPMSKYFDAPCGMATPSVQMMASRGCPYSCAFCLWPQVMYEGASYRARNVGDVVDEMEYLVKERGFKSVYFDDDTFNIGRERMFDLCREIRRRGLAGTPWAMMARPDLMDEEILENMKGAGLWAVKYGVESAEKSLTDGIGRMMDLKKAEAMVRFTQQLGIRTHLTFAFGLPGETRETIKKTVSFVRKVDPFSAQFSIATPFPGTPYYARLEKDKCLVSKNFSDYNGYSKCVVRLPSLASQEIESACRRASKMWEGHLMKRRFFAALKRFLS